MKYLSVILFFIGISGTTYAQSQNSYWLAGISPKVCLTHNQSTIIYKGKYVRPGMGMDGHIGYGRIFPKYAAFAEIDLGYSSYRTSPDAREMNMGLRASAFSSQYGCVQASLKIGFLHKSQTFAATLAPYLGFRCLMVLPQELGSREWVYLDNDHPNIIYDRYRGESGGAPMFSYALTGGVKILYPINKKVSLSLTPFYDLGLKIMSTSIYYSEHKTKLNPDVNSTLISASKGDCAGIDIGFVVDLH